MATYQVIVDKLNRRKGPVTDFADKSNVIGEVVRGDTIEVDEIIDTANGGWARSRDNSYFWNKGLSALAPAAPQSALPAGPAQKDWWFDYFKVAELWKISRGKGVKVAVIDTGLNYNLPDFKDNPNISYYNCITGSSAKADCFDNNGHGTKCAAILCAQGYTVFGVAPDISLLVIKIDTTTGTLNYGAVGEGIRYAIQQGAQVISISSSLFDDDAALSSIKPQIDASVQSGIAVVAAAGNAGELDYEVDLYPASYSHCISVGGITKNETRSKFSVKSSHLKLMGPGEEISSPFGTGLIEGTSFATPFVAGVIAIIKAKAGRPIPMDELLAKLNDGANRSFAAYQPNEHGWGIIDGLKTTNLF